jgi:hypothetical protein
MTIGAVGVHIYIAGLTDPNFFKNLESNWSGSECRFALQIQDDVPDEHASRVCEAVRRFYFQDRRLDYQSYYSLIQVNVSSVYHFRVHK